MNGEFPTGYDLEGFVPPCCMQIIGRCGCSRPTGTDASIDGESWDAISDTGFHVMDVGNDGTIWGAGAGGRVGKLIASPQ